jgi:hypothetical protein
MGYKYYQRQRYRVYRRRHAGDYSHLRGSAGHAYGKWDQQSRHAAMRVGYSSEALDLALKLKFELRLSLFVVRAYDVGMPTRVMDNFGLRSWPV